jgi:hypothetical protein
LCMPAWVALVALAMWQRNTSVKVTCCLNHMAPAFFEVNFARHPPPGSVHEQCQAWIRTNIAACLHTCRVLGTLALQMYPHYRCIPTRTNIAAAQILQPHKHCSMPGGMPGPQHTGTSGVSPIPCLEACRVLLGAVVITTISLESWITQCTRGR